MNILNVVNNPIKYTVHFHIYSILYICACIYIDICCVFQCDGLVNLGWSGLMFLCMCVWLFYFYFFKIFFYLLFFIGGLGFAFISLLLSVLFQQLFNVIFFSTLDYT